MIVTIKAEIFNHINYHSDLDDLFHFFKKGKHRIHLKKKEDFDAFENSTWTKKISRSDKDFLMESISRIDKKEIIVSTVSNESEFNLKEAYAYLQQPLSIVIENSKNDSVFINCIFRNFGIDLLEAKNKHWIKFENGGGANNDTVNGMLNELYNDSIYTKNKEKYLRCFVIKDSDREYCIINSDEGITEQILPENKTKYLVDNNIPFHILFKREMENYMPENILNGFISLDKKHNGIKDFVINFNKLSSFQKDFLDIQFGFTSKDNRIQPKERSILKLEVRNLFANLTDEQYRKIGLGLPFSNFKSDFSRNFEFAIKEDLEKRIQHQPKFKSKVNPKDDIERNEFEHIIHEIKYLL